MTNQTTDSVLASVPSSIIHVIGYENRIPHILSLPHMRDQNTDPFLSLTNDMVRRTNPTISFTQTLILSLSLSLSRFFPFDNITKRG